MSNLNFKPMSNRVFLIADPIKESTSSGIIISTIKPEHQMGTVVAVGTRYDGSEMIIGEGDRAAFLYGKGLPVEINKVTYTVLEESEILWYNKK